MPGEDEEIVDPLADMFGEAIDPPKKKEEPEKKPDEGDDKDKKKEGEEEDPDKPDESKREGGVSVPGDDELEDYFADLGDDDKDKDKDKDDPDKDKKEDPDKKDKDDPDKDKGDDKDKDKKKSPTQQLRDDRDEARRERDELKEEVEKLRPLADLAEVENATELPAKVEALEKELKETKEKLEESGARLREFSISEDPQFVETYQQPVSDALEALQVDLFEVEPDGSVKNADKFAALENVLLYAKEGPVTDPKKIKGILAQFKAKYDEVTGEDYTPPNAATVAKGIRKLVAAKAKHDEAKGDWEKTSEEVRVKRLKEQEEEQIERDRLIAKERDTQAATFIDDYKLPEGAPAVLGTADEFKTHLREAHGQLTKVFEAKPEERPTYSAMVAERAKAMMFGKLIKRIKELEGTLSAAEHDKHEDADKDKDKDKDKGKDGKVAGLFGFEDDEF